MHGPSGTCRQVAWAPLMRFSAPAALAGRSPRCLKLPTSGDPASAFVARRRWPMRFSARSTRRCRPDRSGRLPRVGRGRAASLSVRLGPFIAACYGAMFQTQTTGLATAWPGLDPGGAHGVPCPSQLCSCPSVLRVFATDDPHAVGPALADSAVFAEGRAPKSMRVGRPVRQSASAAGFSDGQSAADPALLPWAFPLPGLQTPRPLVIAAGRAGRVSSPGPATGSRGSASGP